MSKSKQKKSSLFIPILIPLLIVVILIMSFLLLKRQFAPAHSDSPSFAESTPPPASITSALTAVVPHHDLVKSQRLAFWQDFKEKSPSSSDSVDLVIIVAPDHFSAYQNQLTTDTSSWQLQFDELPNFLADQDLPPDWNLSSHIVKNDHAIVNLVAELHQHFPNASFTPFLLGQEMEFSQLEPLLDWLTQTCQSQNCLLVASVDFSHYLPEDLSDQQDQQTLAHLEAKSITSPQDLNSIATLSAQLALDNPAFTPSPEEIPVAVDSPQSLFVLQEFARNFNLNNFWLQNHTNSAFGSPAITSTTSHIFGAYTLN